MEEIAKVYSRSLFQVAQEQGKVDVVRQQLGQVADAMGSDRQLAVFFFSPYFSTQEKKAGLSRVVTGADPIVLNFLELLVEKHRMPALYRIRKQFDDLWAEENQLLPVHLTSATQLEGGVVEQIGQRIANQTGRRVQLSSQVEPDILGGLVLQVGNSILDASIRNRLDQLRRTVARGA